MTMMTKSGVPLQRVYVAENGSGERPGEFPFTRGRSANATSTTWIQRELSGEGNGARSNEQNSLSLGARSDGDRRDRRRAHAIAARPGSSVGARGDRDAGRFLVQKAGFSRPVSRRPNSIRFRYRAPFPRSSPWRGWSCPPAKPDFPWTACEDQFFTDLYIRRTVLTPGISRWSFACVLRSIRSSIARGICRNSMPISKTPISSASAA